VKAERRPKGADPELGSLGTTVAADPDALLDANAAALLCNVDPSWIRSAVSLGGDPARASRALGEVPALVAVGLARRTRAAGAAGSAAVGLAEGDAVNIAAKEG
jgi:hypothetical protein